jgi:hypothetical protein
MILFTHSFNFLMNVSFSLVVIVSKSISSSSIHSISGKLSKSRDSSWSNHFSKYSASISKYLAKSDSHFLSAAVFNNFRKLSS